MVAVVSDSTRAGSREAASFRDPSGFVYRVDGGTVLRQVNACYAPQYRRLMKSGLYEELTADGLLVEHEELPLPQRATSEAAYVLRPDQLPFISYPYEWAFSALKDAALLTLDIHERALTREMALKDASAFNVQFVGCRPVFIDTLSFENYREGEPWVAYGQFCRQFVAPLALMAKRDVDLGRLLSLYIDGIPLELASRLLPWKTRLSLSEMIHIHWHAAMIRKHQRAAGLDKPREGGRRVKLFSRRAMKTLVRSLKDYIQGLSWRPQVGVWDDYYNNNSYTSQSFDEKQVCVAEFLDQIEPRSVWDFGANTGLFSRLATERGASTISLDMDAACVQRSYLSGKHEGDVRLLPLRMDLANPSSSLGWACVERDSLLARGPCELGLALALIHHLAISNNTPLKQIAEFFHSTCQHLIIEWVPKHDPQVQRLLSGREDVFADYQLENFKTAFGSLFELLAERPIGNDGRTVFLMRSRTSTNKTIGVCPQFAEYSK